MAAVLLDLLDDLNRRGRALYPAIFGEGLHAGNWARFIFFNPEARSFYADWDRAARDSVAIAIGGRSGPS